MSSLTINLKLSFLFKLKASLISLLSIIFLSLLSTGCSGSSSNKNTTPTSIINAQSPNITTGPQNQTYIQNQTPNNLSVTAIVTDGGTLSYQWYENKTNGATPISGETNKTFTPSTNNNGTFYYYVVVTNTNDKVSGAKNISIISNTAEIIINLPTLNFYDENLDFIENINITGGTIVNLLTDYPSPTNYWYKVKETTDITQLNVTNNINLYAIPNVQEITTQEELDNIRNNLNYNYILLNNITLDESKAGFNDTTAGGIPKGWIPIGDYYSSSSPFTGIFNANNNTISNFFINRPYVRYIGFFGAIENAQIRNLGLKIFENREINGDNFVGGIAGYANRSNIINSYFIGNINGNNQIGGIAGKVDLNSIINSYSIGDVNGYSQVGGIVGDVGSSNITNSYSTGNISGGNQYTGGIAGYVSRGNITNSYSTGNISGVNEYTGGIVGYGYYGNITNSYSTGNISGYSDVGGIAGYIYSITLQNNAAINPSVTGTYNANRVIGYIRNPSTISNNFALNSMTVNGNTVSNSNVNGIGKTDNELKAQTTYSDDIGSGGLDWKFGDDDNNPWVWSAFEGYPYPTLYWQK
jgi:hypothetical protein